MVIDFQVFSIGMEHHHDAWFSFQDLAQRAISCPKQLLTPGWVSFQKRPQLRRQREGDVPVYDVEHPTAQLLRPFIRVHFPTRTAHPALATKTDPHRLPTSMRSGVWKSASLMVYNRLHESRATVTCC